jgi:uncharacterized protein
MAKRARPPMTVVTAVAPYVDGPAGVHGVLGQAGVALCELGAMAGFEPTVLDDIAGLSTDALSYGVLALFNIGETPFSKKQKKTIVESWRKGRLAILGVHAATDACHTWEDYGDLLGARFDGHPWTQSFDITVVDRVHPSTAHLPATWHWHDEIYLFKSLRPDAQVLLEVASTFDMSVPEARRPDIGMPLAWTVAEGNARTFYTALGHFPGAWETPPYLKHLAGGLEWLLGGG